MKDCPECGDPLEVIMSTDHLPLDDVTIYMCPSCGWGFKLCNQCGNPIRRSPPDPNYNEEEWGS